MPEGKLLFVSRYTPPTVPSPAATTWKGAPMTDWSGAVMYTPTFSPPLKPRPEKTKRVPPGPQLGWAVAFWLAGMPEQASAWGVAVAAGALVAVGCAVGTAWVGPGVGTPPPTGLPASR